MLVYIGACIRARIVGSRKKPLIKDLVFSYAHQMIPYCLMLVTLTHLNAW